ncbi:MAG: adenylate kinase [Bacteroidales bacterium]|nr:adenylate kinase [Bacteroidales bacterium]
MFNLILFGPPGSGKGTQSIKIAEKYNFAHISTGDIFRNEIKNKTELGLRVQGIIESGELVPDELLIELLQNAMRKFHGKAGFVLDGFPRTCQQAKDLDDLLDKSLDCVSLVLALEVNEEEVISRLLKRAQEQGRKDDTEDVIRNRMKVYHHQTTPLEEFYSKQGKFESLHGVGSIDDIFENLCRVIDKHLA